MDWIVLNRLRFDAIVGILASEQVAPQPLELQIKLGVDLDACGSSGDLSKSVDYAAVADQVRFIAQHGRWRLIESMGTCIARLLLAPPAAQASRAAVERVEIHIAKPTILGDLAVPEVVLRRKADWVRLPRRDVPSRTTLETLETTPLSAAYRVHIAPGTSYAPPPQVAFKVMAGRPRYEGRTLVPGDEVARMATVFENHQKQAVTLLAVGHPIS